MSLARLTVICGLLTFVFWEPVRHTLAARWISDGNWSHGWLIPIFSLYFLYTHRESLMRAVPNPTLWGVPILLVSLGVFFWSAWWARMAYPQALMIVPTIIGLVLLMGGWNVLKVVWFPVVFLALAVPLPHRTYFELTTPLRILASQASAAILPLLIPGLHTNAQAVVIDYIRPGNPPGQLNVEEACSGMRLLMAFVTLGIAIAYLGDRPVWQRVVLVAACLPIALFCNIVRVTTTGYLSISGHRDLAQGTAHQLLGLAMLVLALGLFSLLGYVLSHLFVEAKGEE
jgi:exosortase